MTSWLSPDRQPAAPGVSQGGGQKVGQQGRSQQGGGQQGGGGKGGAQQGGGRFPAGFAAPRSGVVGRGEAVAAHTLQRGRAKEEGEGAVVKGPMQVRVFFTLSLLIIVCFCMHAVPSSRAAIITLFIVYWLKTPGSLEFYFLNLHEAPFFPLCARKAC